MLNNSTINYFQRGALFDSTILNRYLFHRPLFLKLADRMPEGVPLSTSSNLISLDKVLVWGELQKFFNGFLQVVNIKY